MIAVTGPDRGGWPAWFFTALAIWRAGGKPLRIRPCQPRYGVAFDGIVIGGGSDVDPTLYTARDPQRPQFADIERAEPRGRRRILGYLVYPLVWALRRVFQVHTTGLDPARDRLEKALIGRALDQHRPILGICRGMQLLNVVHGGSLHRELASFYTEQPNARSILPVKTVTIAAGSQLAAVVGDTPMRVNALHDQAVDRLGHGIRAVASEANGVVQAIEHAPSAFIVGVQWHPEFLPQKRRHRLLFAALVTAARR